MRVGAARDPPQPDEPVIEPCLDDPFPITIKNRCSGKIDIQIPIWNLGIEITAFSFKLQANVPQSSRSSVRRTSAQANAVIKTGRSLLAGKTNARSMETTSSTREIRERKATHVAVDSKGNLERFFSTSFRTHGLAMSFQP